MFTGFSSTNLTGKRSILEFSSDDAKKDLDNCLWRTEFVLIILRRKKIMEVKDLLDPAAILTKIPNDGEDVQDLVKPDAFVRNSTEPLFSPVQAMFRSVWENFANGARQRTLGDVWDSTNALRAYSKGKMMSKDPSSQAIRVVFRNLTHFPLSVCWINYEGEPELYMELTPQPFPSLMNANKITEHDLVQNTTLGDTFAFVFAEDAEEAEVNGDFDDMLGAYRPIQIGVSDDHEDRVLHLVTIEEKHGWIKSEKNKARPDMEEHVRHYSVHSRLVMLDPTPIDTSQKAYTKTEIGGWPVFAEDDWFNGDQELKTRIEADIKAAKEALPEHACKALIESTPIYLNKLMDYGPKACPINGIGMCFHPAREWLEEVGMSPSKAGCIEVYETYGYMNDCDDWGPGGVFLHELSHAYHMKCVKDGFENKDITRCFQKAMSEGLYDNVRVRSEGEEMMACAYACTDACEYFSELSTAFLGGAQTMERFNKWQPFNREEIKTFDPRAYKMLCKMWKLDAETEKELHPSPGKRKVPASGTRRKSPTKVSLQVVNK